MTIIESREARAPEGQEMVTSKEVTPVDRLVDETGATTAEYAITTLAACGFAAVLVVLLKSGEVRSLLMGIITSALSMGS